LICRCRDRALIGVQSSSACIASRALIRVYSFSLSRPFFAVAFSRTGADHEQEHCSWASFIPVPHRGRNNPRLVHIYSRSGGTRKAAYLFEHRFFRSHSYAA
jgi:hypothetical protein